MKSIALIGYMCVGKTTVGKELARQFGFNFYDLDWYIEERYHTKVPEIFATYGEQHFRDLERRMLHEVAEFENIVLSCGGGTPCFFDNIDYLNGVSTTVYLKASPSTILEHLRLSRGKRPLLEGKSPEELADYVETQLAARELYYSKAQLIQEVSPLYRRENIDRICEEITEKIKTADK